MFVWGLLLLLLLRSCQAFLWHFSGFLAGFTMLDGISLCTVGFPSFAAVMACTVTQSLCLSSLGSCT